MYKRDQNTNKEKNTFICNECSADLNSASMYFYNDGCYCQGCCPWKKPEKNLSNISFSNINDFIQSINLQI